MRRSYRMIRRINVVNSRARPGALARRACLLPLDSTYTDWFTFRAVQDVLDQSSQDNRRDLLNWEILVELRGFEPRCSLAMRLGDRERSGTGWMRAAA
jgi:hypothetical protein